MAEPLRKKNFFLSSKTNPKKFWPLSPKGGGGRITGACTGFYLRVWKVSEEIGPFVIGYVLHTAGSSCLKLLV